jgi:hypothetical protein
VSHRRAANATVGVVRCAMIERTARSVKTGNRVFPERSRPDPAVLVSR